MKIYYLPLVDGQPVAWDGQGFGSNSQFALCDDVSYWQDTPHRAVLYTSLDELKSHIEKSKWFRTKHGFPVGHYGWIEVVAPTREPVVVRNQRQAVEA